jgi:hypothetical protein
MTADPSTAPVTDIHVPAVRLRMEGDGTWPELLGRPTSPCAEATRAEVAYLAGATSSGRAGVILRVDLPDGQTVILQFTWRLFATIARAFAGRYGWPTD